MAVMIHGMHQPITLDSVFGIDVYKRVLVDRIEKLSDVKVTRCSLVQKTSTWTNGDPAITKANAVLSCLCINVNTKQVNFHQTYMLINNWL